MQFKVRPVKLIDVPQMLELCRQFNFPTSPESLSNRIHHIMSLPSHVILIAEEAATQRVVGWLHGYEAPSLLSDLTAEGGGLIIHQKFRRLGVGKLLVEAAEKWAQSRGIHNALLATRIDRDDAQKFYQALGYQFIHTTHFLGKKLENEGPGC
jgi:GNAT superfamily N-acetyltransferase